MTQEKFLNHDSTTKSEGERSRPAPSEPPTLDTVLACGAGAGIIGGHFGDAGIFIGAIIGGLFGYYYSKHSHAC